MQPVESTTAVITTPQRVILCGKTTRAIRTPSQIMIAHDVVILSTKISPDALPADTSVRSAQG